MQHFSLSLLLAQQTRRKQLKPTQLIVISFVAVILVGTLLLCLPFASRDGRMLSPLSALFTATSATCVTGLVVVDTYTQFSWFGQMIILLLIQIGGLGLVTLTTFFTVMMGRRLGFKSLQLASESISISDSGQARHLLKVVIKIALTFELIGAVLLAMVFVPQFGSDGVFISLFIAISAFCNAGFDVFGRLSAYSSLTTYYNNPYVLTIVMVLLIAGGLGFLVWHDLACYHRSHHLRAHTKLVLLTTGVLLVLGTIAIALVEWNNPNTLGSMGTFDKVFNALFQSVTARTAGFNTIDLAQCTNITKFSMIILMFIGAAPGGTGGGIKITTMSVLIVTVLSVIKGQEEVTIFKRRIGQKTVYRSLAIIFLAALAVLVSGLTIFYNSGPELNEIDSIFEAVSAFATVGLSVGLTGVMNPLAQLVTIVTMFIGRVGPVSLAISMYGNRNQNKSARAVVPLAEIIVG